MWGAVSGSCCCCGVQSSSMRGGRGRMGWGYGAAINSIHGEIPLQRRCRSRGCRIAGGLSTSTSAALLSRSQTFLQLQFQSPVREGNPPSSMSGAEIPGSRGQLDPYDRSLYTQMNFLHQSLDDVISEDRDLVRCVCSLVTVFCLSCQICAPWIPDRCDC